MENMSKRPSKRWTVDETKAFLHFYNVRKKEFENNRKKRVAYSHVLKDMISAGFDPNIEISHLEVKMTTLMRAYKAAKDNPKGTGACPCPSPFMDEMEEILGDKPIHSESEAFNTGAEGLFTRDDQPLRMKLKRSTDAQELISLSRKRLQPPTSEYDKISAAWAVELQKMTPKQQLFAKKAINEILFEGQLGTLDRNSVQINTSSPLVPTTPHRTFQNSDSESCLDTSNNQFESTSQIQSGSEAYSKRYKNDDPDQHMECKIEHTSETE